MSALDLLPEDVRVEILDPSKRPWHRAQMREDLRLIPEAEAAGWTVTFSNNHWHNGAQFQKGDVHVWYITGRHVGWRRARCIDGYFEPLDYATQYFPTLKEALAKTDT